MSNFISGWFLIVLALAFTGYQVERMQEPNPFRVISPKADTIINVIKANDTRNINIIKPWKLAEFTAYNSEPSQCDSSPDITANGERVHPGGIACPRFLAFGSRVRVHELDRVFHCNDRMNKRFTNRFDIWMEAREEALKFGVRTLHYQIIN